MWMKCHLGNVLSRFFIADFRMWIVGSPRCTCTSKLKCVNKDTAALWNSMTGSNNGLKNFSLRPLNLSSAKCWLKKYDFKLLYFKITVDTHISNESHLTDKCFKTHRYSWYTDTQIQLPFSFCALILHIDSNVLIKSIIGLSDCDVCMIAWAARNENPIILLDEYWSYRVFFPTIMLVLSTLRLRQFSHSIFQWQEKYILPWHHLHQMSNKCPGNSRFQP